MLQIKNINPLLLLPLLLLGLSPKMQAQIQLSTDQPKAGEEVSITLGQAETTIAIAYRPNSSVIRRDTLRSETPQTSFSWTPEQAGVVSLSTVNASRNVSVRFQGFPWQGLIVMLLAGCILFGGAIYAFRVLFKDEEEDNTMDFDPLHTIDT